MATNNRRSSDDAFDPKQYAEETTKSIGSIQQDIDSLNTRVEAIEKRVGDHASLAASFKEAFEKDKDVDKTLTALLSDLLQKDEMRKALSDAVSKADRTWLIARLKSVWGFVVAVILLVIGALVDRLLAH